MIAGDQFPQSDRVAVLGLARSGLAAAQALQLGGARVLAWDDARGKRASRGRIPGWP